jgi:hypothetical protein
MDAKKEELASKMGQKQPMYRKPNVYEIITLQNIDDLISII